MRIAYTSILYNVGHLAGRLGSGKRRVLPRLFLDTKDWDTSESQSNNKSWVDSILQTVHAGMDLYKRIWTAITPINT